MDIEEKKIPPKRFLYVVGMFLVSVICVFVLSYGKKLLLDQALCLVTLFASFWVVFILALMHQRRIGKFTYRATTYRHLFIVTTAGWLLIITISYLPDFFGPIIFVAFLFVAVSDGMLSLASCLFMDLLLCFICSKTGYVLYCYCILSIFGVLFANYLKEKNESKNGIYYVLIFIIQFLIPLIFYDFGIGGLTTDAIGYSFVTAAVVTFVVYFGFGLLIRWDMHEEEVAYDTFCDYDFSLATDLKHFSYADFLHGKKVSELSRSCAREIGVDEQLCACAGLYYHVGIIDGEPIIDNGILLAQKYCLPVDVIRILSEYQGIIHLPSSPESAIVQIVDAIVSKIEAMGEQMESSWNQEMLIYQTLNDFSGNGMYDESNLTMNQFLKIRDCLIIKEDLI